MQNNLPLMDYYILNGKIAVPEANIQKWADWFETADRTVARMEKDNICVSTVFLGLDHSFGGTVPLLFETIVFGGEYDGKMDRYSTWKQAEKGHKKICHKVFPNF